MTSKIFIGVNSIYYHLVIRPKTHNRKYTIGWEVPWYIYNSTTFPNAVSGSGYLISISSVPCLYENGLKTSFLNLEDVFITGLGIIIIDQLNPGRQL